MDPIAQLTALTGLITHCFTQSGITFCNFLMSITKLAIEETMRRCMNAFTAGDETDVNDSFKDPILRQIPSSLHVALRQFQLEGKTSVHAVCPSCKFVHEPAFNAAKGIDEWPATCERFRLDGSGDKCSTNLLQIRGEDPRPIRPYLVP